jgi:hypothetical protein
VLAFGTKLVAVQPDVLFKRQQKPSAHPQASKAQVTKKETAHTGTGFTAGGLLSDKGA